MIAEFHDGCNVRRADEIESRTRRFGEEIFARLDRNGPILFSPAWFDDQLMGLTMSNPALKIQLFRFIDSLPLLKSPEMIASHLREYLNQGGTRLPPWIRRSVPLIPRSGPLAKVLAWSARWNAQRLARRFIAGTNVQEALKAIAAQRKRQLAFTIDLLGEATITEHEAEGVQKQYLELLDGISSEMQSWRTIPLIDTDHRGPIPRVNVSVKLSALFSQFDPIDPVGTSRAVRDRLRPILRSAKQRGAFVNFDMEQYTFKDVTLRIFREILSEYEFHNWPDIGIAIQAYLRDTREDLKHLREWVEERGTSVWVRLVKGAYWDYEHAIAAQNDWPIPVFTEKWQSDESFEDCARYLLEHYEQLRPAFGSHNIRSISYVMAAAEELGVPSAAYEFQMLYGMADPIKEVLISLGRRVRIYTPYGQLLPGMAYLVRRLLENTSNESFLRASFTDNVPEEVLLMNPALVGEQQKKVTGLSSTHGGFRNEPLVEFHRESNQQWMRDAIREVTPQMGRTYSLVINNEWRKTPFTFESRNPSHTEEIVGHISRATIADAEDAIAAARAAFPAWRDTAPAKRAEYLFRVAQLLRERRFELAAWEVFECGKPWREADADIAEAIDFCEYYGREMVRLSQPHKRDVAGEENEYFYEPRGVAIVIAPWNFPLAILCGMTTAALVTGNTVVMKPAEQSSVIAAKFMEVLQNAELPIGVVNYLPGVGEEIGPLLVNHRDVDVIAFTGSLGVALAINESASKVLSGQEHVKRVIAEMGGKNAIIVDADADLDEAVKGVVESAFGYSGQKCSACSRAIVMESIYDQFLTRLIEATRSLTVGPAEEAGSGMGPVIDEEARSRIVRRIEKGKQEARLAFAGELGDLAKEGNYIAPHIFAEVPPDASIAQDEIFGPVLSVIKANDLEDALTIAHGTKYALTGGLFSRSPHNIAEVKRRYRVGNLYINRKITGALVDRQPFGGFKLSGIGSKAGGPDYLLQFVLPRTVTENTMRHGFVPTG